MTPERLQKLQELFAAALECAPAERASFMAEACGNDDALRRAVESLLAHHEQANNFMESPATTVAADLFADEPHESLVGQSIGRYEVLELLGAGGMGEVYLAQDTSLGRKVALKLLPARFTTEPDRLRRFEQEARTASALNHPNIVTIYEIGQVRETHFIATEYLDGVTLRGHLVANRMGTSHAVDIATQVASALAAAHARGVVHRDIKPENIIVLNESYSLNRENYVKVLDFGIAKLTEATSVDKESPTKPLINTNQGVVLGTVSYMSPEQARGLLVDARSDIWSLGVVLYEMLAGSIPFDGETAEDVRAGILKDRLPPLSAEVPERLKWIAAKALRKDREDRYQTAREFFSDLRELQEEQFSSEALREHSVAPELGTPQPGTKPADVAPTSTAPISTAAIVRPPTSSAEYIVAELRRRKRGVVIAVAALLVTTLAGTYFYLSRGGEREIHSVAVMPFVNESGNSSFDYLSDGLSENVIDRLAQLPQLKVIARDSSFKYRGPNLNLKQVANALGVRAIVTGRVVQQGDNVSIRVELIDAGENRQLWSETYNRPAADIQATQAEVARTISERLRVRLTGAQEQQLAKRPTQNPEAYQLYLNGLFYFRKGGIENIKRAFEYYNQAVALDQDFALAWVGLAEVNRWLGGNSMLDSREANGKAEAAAKRALQLDDSLAEAHRAQAMIKLNAWDWAASEREFQRAIELNQNLADAHSGYSHYLSIVGRHTEALAEIQRAQELDPLSLSVRVGKGVRLYYARRFDEAINEIQQVHKLEPDNTFGRSFFGYVYAMKGMYAEAIAQYKKSMEIDGENTSDLCYLGYALAMSGKRQEALDILNRLKTTKEFVSPAELAVLYIGLRDTEAALASLEKAYTERDAQMQYLKADPHFDSLRSDPRFVDLIRRVGLPQ